MSWGSADVYYDPEKFGLTQIGELDDPQACYSFDLLVVWQHTDGRLFYGTDSGCSCPSPFDTYHKLDDLTLLTLDGWGKFAQEVKDHCCPDEYDHSTKPPGHRYLYDQDPQAADKTALLSKVSAILRAGAAS